MLGSVRNQLVLLFSVITAAAIGFIYLYVVPQLQSSLSAEQLRRLQEQALEKAPAFESVIGRGAAQEELQSLALRLSQRAAGARVTLLGVREEPEGRTPAFVVADSEVERTAVIPSYPAAVTALASGQEATAVERVAGERLGESAVPISVDGQTRWVAVLSQSLDDVDANVDLIERQILIAGLIALGAALAAGYFAARAHSGRLRRLEAAAEKVAEGDFTTPIRTTATDEVGQLAGTLDEMRARLARLDEARKEFIANASHELRTPIFSLGGFIELIEDEDPDPEARAEFVRTMREQIVRLEKLTTDLLDLSKLDAEVLRVEREPVDLASLARSVASEFGPAAAGHGSEILVRAGEEAFATADAQRTGQILRILIDNALSHTPRGTTIEVIARTRQGEPEITVADDGPGIDPRFREQVFERFHTGDEAAGSGLGLAIARELARLMGGDVKLSLSKGRTAFTLRLPGASGIGEA